MKNARFSILSFLPEFDLFLCFLQICLLSNTIPKTVGLVLTSLLLVFNRKGPLLTSIRVRSQFNRGEKLTKINGNWQVFFCTLNATLYQCILTISMLLVCCNAANSETFDEIFFALVHTARSKATLYTGSF